MLLSGIQDGPAVRVAVRGEEDTAKTVRSGLGNRGAAHSVRARSAIMRLRRPVLRAKVSR